MQRRKWYGRRESIVDTSVSFLMIWLSLDVKKQICVWQGIRLGILQMASLNISYVREQRDDSNLFYAIAKQQLLIWVMWFIYLHKVKQHVYPRQRHYNKHDACCSTLFRKKTSCVSCLLFYMWREVTFSPECCFFHFIQYRIALERICVCGGGGLLNIDAGQFVSSGTSGVEMPLITLIPHVLSLSLTDAHTQTYTYTWLHMRTKQESTDNQSCILNLLLTGGHWDQ